MSMSQLKTPDEEWDEIWQNVHWYHLPLVALALVGMWLCLHCRAGVRRPAKEEMRKALSVTGWSVVGLSLGVGIFHKVVDLTNQTLYHNSVEWLGNLAAVGLILGVSLLTFGGAKS